MFIYSHSIFQDLQYDIKCRLLGKRVLRMNKKQRLHLITELISTKEVKTQEELQQLLLQRGLRVTQATISRDIHELKLVKVQSQFGSLKYCLHIDQNHLILEKLRHKFKDAFEGMEVIDSFILVKTLPGNAHAFGALLDSIELDGKAGTICGNDTCLIICKSRVKAKKVKQQLDTFGN